jgi:hypothetical protein
VEAQRTSPEFFNVLSFVLTFCPAHSSELALRERFARLGIAGGTTFRPGDLAPEILQAVKDGMADAWAEFGARWSLRIRARAHPRRGAADLFLTVAGGRGVVS